MTKHKLSTCLIAIFCLALAVRLMFFFLFLHNNPCLLMYDAGHYHEVAASIIAGKGYSSAAGQPYFYRLPGYPLLLAACYALTSENVLFTLLIHVVIASLIPVLLALLAWRLFLSLPTAYLAGLLAALHPGLMIFSGLLMSESLFLILLCGFLYFFLPRFISPQERQGGRSLFVAGVLLGGASLVRPVGHLMLPFIFFLLIMLRRLRWRDALHDMVACGTGWFLVVLPWLVRNVVLTGQLFFHTLPGVHFLNHAATRVHGAVHGLPYAQSLSVMRKQLTHDEQQAAAHYGRPLQEIESCNVAERLAFKVMLHHPWHSVKFACINMTKTLCGLYSSELLMIDSGGLLPSYDGDLSFFAKIKRFLLPTVHNKGIIAVVYYEIGMMLFLYLLTVLCLWRYARLQERRMLALTMVCFLAFFVGISFACGFARLRLACEIFFIVLASSQLHRQIYKKERLCLR